MRTRASSLGLGFALISCLAFGCGDDESDDAGSGYGDGLPGGGDDGADGWDDGGDGGGDDGWDDGGGDDGGGDGGGDDGGDDGGGDGGDEGGGDDGEDGDGGDDGDGGGVGPEPGQLTAGEWNDLEHWGFWRGLFEQEGTWAQMESHWKLYTEHRVPVQVLSAAGEVADARVSLVGGQGTVVWEARTDNFGRAELFAGLFGGTTEETYEVVVEAGDETRRVSEVTPGIDEAVIVDMVTATFPHQLDLMFVVDTTGSMGDELSYLQAELEDVIERVENQAGKTLDVRLSVNFYRDHGDEYVVRDNPFTRNITEAIGALRLQRADGGGDYEEAVEVALANAVEDHEWSGEARARLLFLVLDAPPHYDANRVARIQEAVKEAARLGIRIIPLAASGVDKHTEFLLRFLDVSTNGTYTFLTDDSGIGNPHLDPTIGPFEVEYLNNLLVRVISEAVE